MVDKSTDTAPVTDSDIFAKDDAEFREIQTSRFMYNAEKCGGVPLVGNLLNILSMPPIVRAGKARPWNAFLIRTTRPTKGVGRSEAVEDVPVGAEVLIPATYELDQFFRKAATAEQYVYEVKIQPFEKIDIGSGQEMWTYKLAAKPTPEKRGRFGLAAVLGPQQLPAIGDTTDNDSAPF